MIKNIFTILFIILLLYSCTSTSPTNVQTSDTQKVTAVEYGIIKTSLPVKDNQMDLGTWQGIFLFEHRIASMQRRLKLTLFGN